MGSFGKIFARFASNTLDIVILEVTIVPWIQQLFIQDIWWFHPIWDHLNILSIIHKCANKVSTCFSGTWVFKTGVRYWLVTLPCLLMKGPSWVISILIWLWVHHSFALNASSLQPRSSPINSFFLLFLIAHHIEFFLLHILQNFHCFHLQFL